MADFDKAIMPLIIKEGGAKYTNDPDDPGGATKYGISQKSYPNLDIKNLTQQVACDIYKRDYWDALNLDLEPNQHKASLLFENAVNMGVGITKIMQNKIMPYQTLTEFDVWQMQFKILQILRYVAICNRRQQSRKFLLGWMNRIFS